MTKNNNDIVHIAKIKQILGWLMTLMKGSHEIFYNIIFKFIKILISWIDIY